MARSRDISKVLSSSTSIALDNELGLSLITPSSIAATGGSGSISSTGKISFTSASSISLNGIFSSTYQNYKVLFQVTAPTSGVDLTLRLRASGSDLTGASYDETVLRTITSTVSGYTTQSATSWDFQSVNLALRVSELTLFNPFTTAAKFGINTTYAYSTASNYRLIHQGLGNQAATAAE